MPAKKIKPARTRRLRPKNLTTKEELIEYLERNSDLELPFLEELWDVCLIKANENKEMGRSYIDDKGEEHKKRGYFSENPVSWYFKMANTNGWKQKAMAKMEGIPEKISESKQKIIDTYCGDNDVKDSNEIIDWINLFEAHERSYLLKRYAYYFDVYEINEGADRVLLKRILSFEIALHRIDIKRANRQNVNISEETKLLDALNDCLESMKWTKKQRNAREDMAQNKFTVWLDNMAKEGEFKPEKHTFEKDEVDFLLETYIDSAREMMN